MLVMDEGAARTASERRNVRTLGLISVQCEALLAAEDKRRALGAGLAMLDVALRVAAPPSSNDERLRQ